MFRVPVKSGLELRQLALSDADDVFSCVDENRDFLREWLPWVDSTRCAVDVRNFIERTAGESEITGGVAAGVWFEGRFIGGFGLHYRDHTNGRTEAGYWLAPAFNGRGIMTNCCRAAIQYAFHELHFHRFEIRCATGNLRSRRIPERLGFTLEGTLRGAQLLHGQYVDLVVYGLLRTDHSPKISSAA